MTTTRSRPLPLLDEVTLSSPAGAGDEHDDGIGALLTTRGRLPLAALDVVGRIDGLLSQMTVRQTFVNATGEPLEATYIFPIPDRAAVTDFRMEVAERVVEGVLKERGKARREYSQAVHQGHRASIAEEERPGVFSLRVGNLMPGDVATVQLTMVGVLPYSDGEVTFRFPLVVAPRYIPGVPLSGPSVGGGTAVDTNAVPDASRISPPVLLPGFPNPVRLSLTIDLYDPADNPRVSLFSVWGEEHPGVRRLTLQPGERLDRDFILRFRLGGDAVRTSLSLHPDTAESVEGTFALTIVPPVSSVDQAVLERPRDVVLLLDRSGSMKGWKMVAARRAIARMTDTLNDADRFAVIAFDDRIETPPQEKPGNSLIPATDRNRFKAVEFLAKLESRGGTEIAQPLDQAVELFGESRLDRDHVLVLVTDGQVGNEDQVLKVLGARLKGIRVFTLGIDRAVNGAFLRRLTDLGQGGGACELVESEDRLDSVMDAIHRRIGTPVLTDVCIEPEAPGLDFLADTLVPDRPPSLFAGSPLLLMGRYRGRPKGPVLVRGKTPAAEIWDEAIVPIVCDNPAIAAAWARGQVRQLEDRYAAGLDNRSGLEQTIIATSLRFGVLCRFTAYVAVDRAAVVNEGGELHQITQPVELPAGWGEASTSTDACFMATGGLRFEDLRPCLSHPSLAASFTKLKADSGTALPRALAKRSASGIARRAAAPPSPPASLDKLCLQQGGFELLEKISEDEHGSLYNGRDRRKRTVMVRSLKKPVRLDSSAALERLEKDFKRLKHQAIVPILKLIGESRIGRVIAIVSEFSADPTLSQRLNHPGLPRLREAAFFVLVLAEALEYAGRKHMIHGNLTPSHILIGHDGKPRITGFGLASLECGPNVSCATVRVYVAPELLRIPGARPTAQTDVYSLGVILYRLLTGALPERDQGNQKSQSPRTINPVVPVELEAICLKAMAGDPAARYAGSSELAGDLRTFLGVKKGGLLGRKAGRSTSNPAAPPTEKEQHEDFWK
jgi:Ca-activated chloride channel family protein